MKVLLIYPEFPVTFWSFKYALQFISKKVNNPPLGLITIASLLPAEWNCRLVDMNASRLKNLDLEWADYIMISAMSLQRQSVTSLVRRCKPFHKKIVAGGPLFTEDPDGFPDIDHLILNEAEITLPEFLDDLENNKTKRIYTTEEHPLLDNCPVPRFDLLEISKYNSMCIQFSRGCPFDCEFCEITQLLGRKMRLKSVAQVIAELDALYACNWRGSVFFVDDNFIGNKSFLKYHLLPAINEWMHKKKFPFSFSTEASINLADDPSLMDQMVAAGFNMVFVGIETIQEESLVECNKHQNKNRNLLESVKEIQTHGLQVTGGFIVGFDHDPPSIFQRQIDFIQKSGIITAMVGLLNAPPKTRLYKRLARENRITSGYTGNNTTFSTNFIPKMKMDELIAGYKTILAGIYSCKPYYIRVREFLKNYTKKNTKSSLWNLTKMKAFIKSIFILGIFTSGRRQFWRLFFWSLFRMPGKFGEAISYAIYGYHFRKIFGIKV
jgi:radical SAM superfamily enzyme YgiQ (UPF0313 family)